MYQMMNYVWENEFIEKDNAKQREDDNDGSNMSLLLA